MKGLMILAVVLVVVVIVATALHLKDRHRRKHIAGRR